MRNPKVEIFESMSIRTFLLPSPILSRVEGSVKSAMKFILIRFENLKKKKKRGISNVDATRNGTRYFTNIIRRSEKYATQFHRQLRRCPCRFFLLAIVVLRPISWQSSEKFRIQRERERLGVDYRLVSRSGIKTFLPNV